MKMYVSNLGFHVSEDDLKKLFEAYGTVVSARVITDRETGRSRGFAFVEMSSGTEAENAMGRLNGKELEGRAINISAAREREERPKRKW
jgi:RNA recognition motif-containing protein